MKKQALATVISILLALSFAGSGEAFAQPSQPLSSGFYGGVSVRDGGAETQGLTFGPAPSFGPRLNTLAGDDSASRSLLFGGYRFANDVSVEASFASADKYSLRPSGVAGGSAVGLNLAPGARSFSDVPSRSWNVDVLTSWSFLRNLSLYGRLGYAQNDTSPVGGATFSLTDPRRVREGVNYGVGLRYNVSPALGLKVEYARFGRFAGEFSGPLPDSDQVSVGLQLRF